MSQPTGNNAPETFPEKLLRVYHEEAPGSEVDMPLRELAIYLIDRDKRLTATETEVTRLQLERDAAIALCEGHIDEAAEQRGLVASQRRMIGELRAEVAQLRRELGREGA